MSNPTFDNDRNATAISADLLKGELAKMQGPSIGRECEKVTAQKEGFFSHILGNVVVTGTFAGGAVEDIEIAAKEFAGRPRIAFSNSTDHTTYFIPSDIAKNLYDIIFASGKEGLTPAETLRAIGDELEGGRAVGFLRPALTHATFQLPDGLRSVRSLGVMPSFNTLYNDPSLAEELFVVGSSSSTAAVLFREKEGHVLISADRKTYRIPTDTCNGDVKTFVIEKLNQFVDGKSSEFAKGMQRFQIRSSWYEAGGPFFFVISEGRYGFGGAPFGDS